MKEFLSSKNKSVCFCLVDNIFRYESGWTRELIKNQADFTVSNIFSKKYDLFQDQDEDVLLKHAADQGYKYAVVFSTGTEFINGKTFFSYVNDLIKTSNFFIAGHLLDRKESHYELHHQCYVINLEIYRKLQHPFVGKQQLGVKYKEIKPKRSEENFHDDYTPIWIKSSLEESDYIHRCHGWNLISLALKGRYTIVPFNEIARSGKKHLYPENQALFVKNLQWVYSRIDYCANSFVHKSNTEFLDIGKEFYEQIIIPASGLSFLLNIRQNKNLKIVIYDYNQSALDYWKKNLFKKPNIEYDFVKTDLLIDGLSKLTRNVELKTVLNISNIFCYEGTAMLYSTEYRFTKETELFRNAPKTWKIVSSQNSWTGFGNQTNSINEFIKPTWHSGEWNSSNE
jgi:hypothetical protein